MVVCEHFSKKWQGRKQSFKLQWAMWQQLFFKQLLFFLLSPANNETRSIITNIDFIRGHIYTSREKWLLSILLMHNDDIKYMTMICGIMWQKKKNVILKYAMLFMLRMAFYLLKYFYIREIVSGHTFKREAKEVKGGLRCREVPGQVSREGLSPLALTFCYVSESLRPRFQQCSLGQPQVLSWLPLVVQAVKYRWWTLQEVVTADLWPQHSSEQQRGLPRWAPPLPPFVSLLELKGLFCLIRVRPDGIVISFVGISFHGLDLNCIAAPQGKLTQRE